jgi:hypothetical protein
MSWIQTVSGRQFWPLAPKAEDVDIGDIAHALAMKCRYSGHTQKFYSVAEHSVHISLALLRDGWNPTTALWGLLHDAAEAVHMRLDRAGYVGEVGFGRDRVRCRDGDHHERQQSGS